MGVMVVRELFAGETMAAAEALLCLREDAGPAERLVARIDELQRPEGYRLVASFDETGQAVAAGGFRVGHNLAWGRFVYVDDLVTLPEARGRGNATALLRWILDEAVRLDCVQVHLDSGTERHAAHSLYLRVGMHISSHHFRIDAPSAAGAEQTSWRERGSDGVRR
jgi:GNAT superfamily N-acetyltransferase